MFEEYLSIMGLALLAIAWIPETLQNWRERGRSLNLKFVCIYLLGSILLAYHAIIIKDAVFMCLSILAILMTLFNAIVIIAHPGINKHNKKKKKK